MEYKVKHNYKLTGLVYGNYWGGGEGGYSATKLENTDKKQLIRDAKNALTDGTLDSGMGYESLIGALLFITDVSYITIKGIEYINKQVDTLFIGKLTAKQKEFLSDAEISL